MDDAILALIRKYAMAQPFGIDAETKLVDDLMYDAIAVIDLCMAVEDGLGIEITDDAMHAWVTVGDVLKVVRVAA